MNDRRLKLSEIAGIISRTDGLSDEEAATCLGRVRNAARLGFLEGGRATDARGTWDYPAYEVHRARILDALLNLSLDAAKIAPLITRAAAESRAALSTDDWPDRTRVDGGHVWRGFADIVQGVREGEPWCLVIRLFRPGFTHGQRVTAAFTCGDHDRKALDSIFGSTPLATVTLDLADVFAGLDA